MFKLIDPINKRLMLSIKDPKIPIKPLDASITGINLEKAIEHFSSS